MDFSTKSGAKPPIDPQKRHHFSDTPNDTCPCSTNPESTGHFLLNCPLYVNATVSLLDSVNAVILPNGLDITNINELTNLLLYGHSSVSDPENKMILNATLDYISQTGRFS